MSDRSLAPDLTPFRYTDALIACALAVPFLAVGAFAASQAWGIWEAGIAALQATVWDDAAQRMIPAAGLDPGSSPLAAVSDSERGRFIALCCVAPLFGGIGLLIAGLALRRWVAELPVASLVAEFPNQPWRQSVPWARCEGRRTTGQRTWTAAFMVAVIALFMGAIGGNAWVRGQLSGLLVAVMGVFIAGGVLLTLFSLRRGAASKRYGGVKLELSQVPLVPGEAARVTLRLPSKLDGARALVAVLRLSKVQTYRRRKTETATDTVVVWEEQQQIPASAFAVEDGRHVISFDVRVPDDQPESKPEGDLPQYFWAIVVKADTAGLDLDEDFEVPVWRLSAGQLPAMRRTA